MGGGERPSSTQAPTWLGEVGSPGTRTGQGARSQPWGRLLTGAGPPTHPDFPTTIYHLKWAYVTRGKMGVELEGWGRGEGVTCADAPALHGRSDRAGAPRRQFPAPSAG
jgi:hypothetical protein